MAATRHLLMIPLSAYGHMIPLFELASRLATSCNFKMTFVVSAHLLEEIKRRSILKPPTGSNITLYPLQHDVTRRDEAQDATGSNNVTMLMTCFNQAVQQFLRSIYNQENNKIVHPEHGPVDIVICDNFIAGFVDICYEKTLPIYHFATASARAMLLKPLLFDTESPLIGDFDFDNWTAPEETYEPLPWIEKQFFTGIKHHSRETFGIIVNSVQEIEESTLSKIRQVEGMQDKPIFFVGPLIPEDYEAQIGDNTSPVLEWLDGQADGSVIYVSFGTIASLKPEQMEQLAKALVSSGHPFIWSLYDGLLQQSWDYSMLKAGICSPDSVDPNAPFLVLNWVPQKALLKRSRKLAAFISHCGWNSILETLWNGARLVCWPMFGDQEMNAELLESLGVGVHIKGTGMKPKRVVEAKEISEVIEKIKSDQSIGKNISKVRQIVHEAAATGSSVSALNELTTMLSRTFC